MGLQLHGGAFESYSVDYKEINVYEKQLYIYNCQYSANRALQPMNVQTLISCLVSYRFKHHKGACKNYSVKNNKKGDIQNSYIVTPVKIVFIKFTYQGTVD